jgi:hypothetical protein
MLKCKSTNSVTPKKKSASSAFLRFNKKPQQTLKTQTSIDQSEQLTAAETAWQSAYGHSR